MDVYAIKYKTVFLLDAKMIIDQRPKLLILCQFFYPELISTGQTLTELCEELTSLGVDTKVLCGPPTVLSVKEKVPMNLIYKDIKIRRVWGTTFSKDSLPGRVSNQLSYAMGVLLYLIFDFSGRPIMVLTSPPFLVFICAMFRLITRRPYIYLIHDVYPDAAVKIGVLNKKGMTARVWECLNRIAIKHASFVVVIGRCMEKIIRGKMANGTVYSGEIKLIHIWGDDRNITPIEKDRNPLVKLWGLEHKFVVGYSGSLARFHDIETIMEAARDLRGLSEILFIFVGEGYKKKMAEDYVRKNDLQNCEFHKHARREDLPYLISCFQVGLVSLIDGYEGISVPSKTFGMLAGAIPIIGILPESSEIALVIKEEHCGILVKPGDKEALKSAILTLYSKPDVRKEMGRNARRAIDEKYSLNAAALKYKSLIEKLQNR